MKLFYAMTTGKPGARVCFNGEPFYCSCPEAIGAIIENFREKVDPNEGNILFGSLQVIDLETGTIVDVIPEVKPTPKAIPEEKEKPVT